MATSSDGVQVEVERVFIGAGCNRIVNNVSWAACDLVSFETQNAVSIFCPKIGQILITLPGHKAHVNCTHCQMPSNKFEFKEKETQVEDGAIVKIPGEESESGTLHSEQMEMEIAQILEKIDRFTQLVSVAEFEEQMIIIHKEQMKKLQEVIQEVCLLDAANEEIDTLLQNAKYLFQNIHCGT